MKKIKGDYRVNQSNLMVEGKFNLDMVEGQFNAAPLNLVETQIIKTLISTIEPDTEDISSLRMSIDNFLELTKVSKTNHTTIKKICEDLALKRIRLQSLDSDDWINTGWVSEMRYDSRQGIIEFDIPKTTQRYYREFAKGYVSYELKYVLMAKSTYTIRIYELAKKWEHVGKKEYDLNDFREKIGALGDSYNTYSNLKLKALNRAKKEINEKTDITIDFKEIKEGRKVVAIELIINPEEPKEPKEPKKPKKKKEAVDESFELPRLNKDKELDNFTSDMFTR